MKKTIMLAFLSLVLLCSSVFAAAGDKDMARGKKLYGQKKYEQAYSAFEKAAKASPKNSSAYMYMGYCSVGLKDKQSAIKNFEKALSIRNDPALRKYAEALKGGKSTGGWPAAAGAYYYKGGQNRSLALGNPLIVLKDASAALDIYGGGRNTAGLAMRQKHSMITADLNFYSISTSMKGVMIFVPMTMDTSRVLFMPGGDPARNMAAATYWLTNDDVLNLNFGLALIGIGSRQVINNGTPTDVKEGATALIPCLEYSRRIMKGFTLGAAIGGTYSWFNNAIGGAVTESRMNMDRIDWQVSGAYELGSGGNSLIAGLAVGDMNPVKISDNMSLWRETNSDVPVDYIDGFSQNTLEVSEAGGFRTEDRSRIDVSGINTSLSGTYKTGGLEAMAVFGVTAGIGGKTSGSSRTINISNGTEVFSSTLDPYTSASGGALFCGILKGRYSVEIMDIGLAVTGKWSGIDLFAYDGDTDPVRRAGNGVRFDTGAALKLGQFTIPVEFGFDISGYTDADDANTEVHGYTTFVVKTGCEYKLMKELALRAGFSFINSSQTWSFNGTAGANPGEAGNPVQSGIGLHAGAGYTLGKIDLDAVFGIRLLGQSPLGANVTAYGETEILASAGANIPL